MAFYMLLLLTCFTSAFAFWEQKRQCVCTQEYSPVCGATSGRRITYSNNCQANCAGANVIHTGACARSECRCSRQYRPVCGTDNAVYDNQCIADCVGVAVQYAGQCLEVNPLAKKSVCVCTMEYNPVCGSDGVTYGNPCQARCSGATVVSSGSCGPQAAQLPAGIDKKQVCACPTIYRPVCGTDGQTYSSSCLAACSGVSVASEGACGPQAAQLPAGIDKKSVCICTANYQPVCGSDGKTYANACQASCSGASVASEGSCPLLAAQLPAGIDRKRQLCGCQHIYRPVCDAQGNQYGNKCVAKCAGVAEADISDPPCTTISHHSA